MHSPLQSTLRALLMVTGVTATLPQLALAQDVRTPAGAEVIDTIVVTGSSIRSQAGAIETRAQPIQYISEEQFTNTKAESVGDFLRTFAEALQPRFGRREAAGSRLCLARTALCRCAFLGHE